MIGPSAKITITVNSRNNFLRHFSCIQAKSNSGLLLIFYWLTDINIFNQLPHSAHFAYIQYWAIQEAVGTSHKKQIKNEIGVQWRHNYELIMVLTSSIQSSSMITMPIIDDYVVKMCPSDLIGWDNRGTKGVRLGQKVIREPVSD